MSYIRLTYHNNTFMRVDSDDRGLLMTLADKFSLYAENYKFDPRYKEHLWDGKIRLFNPMKRTLYIGLYHHVKKFCQDFDVKLTASPEIEQCFNGNIDKDEFVQFVQSLNIHDDEGNPITPYAHQWLAAFKILQKKRTVILSSTSSGKSLILYIVTRWLQHKKFDKKILIAVPNTFLVEQLFSDFDGYAQKDQNWFSDGNINRIYGYEGVQKTSVKPVTISTWQSIHKMNKGWYTQFGGIFIDEAHEAKGKSLTKVLENATYASYKVGLTGSLDDCKANHLTLTGLMGEPIRVSTNKEMIDKGIATNLLVHPIQLVYNDKSTSDIKTYLEEQEYIKNNQKRLNFISNFIGSLSTNTLVLFKEIEHGKSMMNHVLKHQKGKQCIFIDATVSIKDRQTIKKVVEENNNIVIFASYKIFSTGISIRNLHNIILASGTKSKIRVLQSLGRLLRLHKNKSLSTIYDMVDSFKIKYGRVNYSTSHFLKRYDYYKREQFDYKSVTIKL